MTHLFILFDSKGNDTDAEHNSCKIITADTHRCPQNHACLWTRVHPVGGLI